MESKKFICLICRRVKAVRDELLTITGNLIDPFLESGFRNLDLDRGSVPGPQAIESLELVGLCSGVGVTVGFVDGKGFFWRKRNGS